jgi:hypothetical protein
MIIPALRRLCLILLAIALVIVSGCKDELITEYDAPRDEQERLLAVMMPHGKTTWWYFVLSGPAEAATAHQDEFDKFIKSVDFAGKEPKWSQPDGWKRQPKSGKRFAIFELGDADHPLELTVSKLDGPMAGDTLMNVNRWREQIGLGAILDSELNQFVQEPEVNGTKVVRIDLTGPGGVKRQAPAALPPDPIEYEVPDEWKVVKNPPEKMRGIKRWATFEASAGDKTAEVSIQVFGGGGTDLENVTRWRRQLKLPEVGADELKKHVREGFKLAGEKALYADISGDGADGERILGVLESRGKVAWAFKMQGPKAVVASQQAIFDKFLETVRFPDNEGGD